MTSVAAKRYIWDVFISHASEDKVIIARPLANLLATSGLKVWFDEGELTVGDSIRGKIDHGLANARFGVLILSKSFFAKKWPKAELDGLFSTEENDEVRILPVWHEMDLNEIKANSPIIAGRLGVRTNEGVERVSAELIRAIEAKCFGRRRDQPLFSGRLTKKILLSAPKGSVYITNTINRDLSPRIAVQLEEKNQREQLWKTIKAKEASGRVCYIFKDWAGYRDHMASRSIWDVARDGLTSD